MDVESGVRVLAERPADDFEPTEEEVKNYAEWLGLDPKEDTDLMYLAKEGLKAPLKDGWKPCTNSDNEIFYFNFLTGQTSWTHPADEAYRTMVQEKKRARGQAVGVPVAPWWQKHAKSNQAGFPTTSQMTIAIAAATASFAVLFVRLMILNALQVSVLDVCMTAPPAF